MYWNENCNATEGLVCKKLGCFIRHHDLEHHLFIWTWLVPSRAQLCEKITARTASCNFSFAFLLSLLLMSLRWLPRHQCWCWLQQTVEGDASLELTNLRVKDNGAVESFTPNVARLFSSLVPFSSVDSVHLNIKYQRLLWVGHSLDPQAEAEVPTVAVTIFIGQKVARETD